MLGAIIGDMVGSPYEFDRNNIKSVNFPLWQKRSGFTDDTVMTIAVAEAIMAASHGIVPLRRALVSSMREYGKRYPGAGYGESFANWIDERDPQPYGSWGNGSAMRVSPAGWACSTLAETETLATATAEVTHNHPEGIKGARSTAVAIFLARTGSSIDDMRTSITERYGYRFDFTLDAIRPAYHHVESCQESVPQAMEAFFESTGYEDAIRKAISIGGDSDTIAAIAGGIAEAYWGIPENIKREGLSRLDDRLRSTVRLWHASVNDLQGMRLV